MPYQSRKGSQAGTYLSRVGNCCQGEKGTVISDRAGPLLIPSLQGTSGWTLRISCSSGVSASYQGRRSLSCLHCDFKCRLTRRLKNYRRPALPGLRRVPWMLPTPGSLEDTSRVLCARQHCEGRAGVIGRGESVGPSDPLWPQKPHGCSCSTRAYEGLPEFLQVFTQECKSGAPFRKSQLWASAPLPQSEKHSLGCSLQMRNPRAGPASCQESQFGARHRWLAWYI